MFESVFVTGPDSVRRLETFRLATAWSLESTAPNVAAISLQPTGAISYELGQPVVSWDSLNPRWLDRTLRGSRRTGIVRFW